MSDTEQKFSYDVRCAELADVFLSDEASASMPNAIYAHHAARLAQEIQDTIEMFCGYDTEWQAAKSISESATAGHRDNGADPDESGSEQK